MGQSRYLKFETFTKHTGKPFMIADPEEGIEEHEASVAEALQAFLSFFDVNHDLFAFKENPPKVLSDAQADAYNSAVATLKADPQEADFEGQQWHRLDSAEYEVIKKVTEWVMPLSRWWREGKIVKDLLAAAGEQTQLPESPGQGEDAGAEAKGDNAE